MLTELERQELESYVESCWAACHTRRRRMTVSRYVDSFVFVALAVVATLIAWSL